MKISALMFTATAAWTNLQASHPCESNTCDTRPRFAKELEETCTTDRQLMAKSSFRSGKKSGKCDRTNSMLVNSNSNTKDNECTWTSPVTKLKSGHGDFESMYVKFKTGDYYWVNRDEEREVEIRTCTGKSASTCGSWYSTIETRGAMPRSLTWWAIDSSDKSVSGYLNYWYYQTLYPYPANRWAAKKAPLKRSETHVQARVRLTSSSKTGNVYNDHWQAMVFDDLEIHGACGKDEARGVCHQTGEGVNDYQCSCRHGYTLGADGQSCGWRAEGGVGNLNGDGIQNNNEVINDQNIRADGQVGSNRNQVTRFPTPAPPTAHATWSGLHFVGKREPTLSEVWEIEHSTTDDKGDDCAAFISPDGMCVADNGSSAQDWQCKKNGKHFCFWYQDQCWRQNTRGCRWTYGPRRFTSYGNNEHCKFKLKSTQKVQSKQFDLENWYYDTLKITQPGKSTKTYTGNVPFTGVKKMQAGTTFEFRSDYSVTREGFLMCVGGVDGTTLKIKYNSWVNQGETEQIAAQEALEDAPTAFPTQFPTKIQDSKPLQIAELRGAAEDGTYGWTINKEQEYQCKNNEKTTSYPKGQPCCSQTRTRKWYDYQCKKNGRHHCWYYKGDCQTHRRYWWRGCHWTWTERETTTDCTQFNYDRKWTKKDMITGKDVDTCKVQLTDKGTCITDGAGNYENYQKCKFSFHGQGVLSIAKFDTEYHYDRVKMGRQSFHGGDLTSMREQLTESGAQHLSGVTKFEFSSDVSITRPGFKLCVKYADGLKSLGSKCTAVYKDENGDERIFEKPVGWVGSGPGTDYCNIWKCDPARDDRFNNRQFTEQPHGFKRSHRVCHIEEYQRYTCDNDKNFVNGLSYRQISLTDGCKSAPSGGSPICNDNPKYCRAKGADCTNSYSAALAYCKNHCDSNVHGCTGFFMQTHNNGHEICGFYTGQIQESRETRHGHRNGAVCRKSSQFSYCSHTSCTYEPSDANDAKSTKVIRVHSDHREENGGFHKCGFSTHFHSVNGDNVWSTDASRPACDCVCTGLDQLASSHPLYKPYARRQDKQGFERTLNEISQNLHPFSSDNTKMPADFNNENWYYWPDVELGLFQLDRTKSGTMTNMLLGDTWGDLNTRYWNWEVVDRQAKKEIIEVPGTVHRTATLKMSTQWYGVEHCWTLREKRTRKQVAKGGSCAYYTSRCYNNHNSYCSWRSYTSEVALKPSTQYEFEAKCNWGDGWNGAKMEIDYNGQTYKMNTGGWFRNKKHTFTTSATTDYVVQSYEKDEWEEVKIEHTQGKCQLEDGTWHVTNNRMDACVLGTSVLRLPEHESDLATYADCKITAQVTDRDYNGHGKESHTRGWRGPEASDYVYMDVINRNGYIAAGWHHGDMSRRLVSRSDPTAERPELQNNFDTTEADRSYLGTVPAKVNIYTRSWGYETGWDLLDSNNNVVASGGEKCTSNHGWRPRGCRRNCRNSRTPGCYKSHKSPAGTYNVNMRPGDKYTLKLYDSYGDGWHGGYATITSGGKTVTSSYNNWFRKQWSKQFTMPRTGKVTDYFVYDVTHSGAPDDKTQTWTTSRIPAEALHDGFMIRMEAHTNNVHEHWLVTDFNVKCRRYHRQDARVADLVNRQPSRPHTDFTTDANQWDAKYNKNNFYSSHDNHDRTTASLQEKQANEDANTYARGGVDRTVTQYSENDHTYQGQQVAHLHIDS